MAKKPGFSRAVGVRGNRLDRQRALIRAQRGRHELDRGSELLARIGVDRQPHRLADLDQRDGLFGHRQLDAQRIDPHHRGDASPARDVVADADQPLGDQPGQRRPDRRVGHGLAGERDARTRAFERAIRLLGRGSVRDWYFCRAASTWVRRWSNSLCEMTF